MKTMSVIRTERGLIPKSDKMRYVGVFLIMAFTVLALSATGQALELKTDSEWNMHVNGYMDIEYGVMGPMPMYEDMPMGGEFMRMPVEHELAQEHFNLLFDAEKGLLRWHLNLELLESLTSGSEDWDKQHLLEAYGEYTFDDSLRLRVGKFLAPFGIYNDVRYMTPMYASVVLPLIYDAEENYSGTPLTPPPAVGMLSGQYWGDKWDLYYAAYVGVGEKEGDNRLIQQIDSSDIGESFGGRIKATFDEKLTLGFSSYTVRNQSTRSYRPVPVPQSLDVESPREFTWGVDMEYEFPGNVTLQAEVVRSNF